MRRFKNFSVISISVLMSLTTMFSCSSSDDPEKVSFVKEEKIHELNKMKDLISDNVEDFSSIDDIFNRYDNSINEAEAIKEITSLYDSCIKEVYSLIPVKEEFDFTSLSEEEKTKLLDLVDSFILRNNLSGIYLSSSGTLNLNSTTYEQWEEFFGENGKKCQTQKKDYWDVKPFLSNKHFLKGLNLCLDKELFKDEIGSGFIDYSKSEYFNYDLELSRKYFSVALDEIKDQYHNFFRPAQLKLEIAFYSKEERYETLFNKLKNCIETAFNDQTVTGGKYVLEVQPWYGEVFSQIFPEKCYCGQFDLSYCSISGSYSVPYERHKMLSTNPCISRNLTLNWNFDTSNADKDSIVYDGYRYSYDTIVSALN